MGRVCVWETWEAGGRRRGAKEEWDIMEDKRDAASMGGRSGMWERLKKFLEKKVFKVSLLRPLRKYKFKDFFLT